jgi:hypothetical protein
MLIAAAAAVAAIGVAVGLLVSSWTSANRDENAQVDCLSQPHDARGTNVHVVTREGTHVCVYADDRGRTVETRPLSR